MNFRMSYITSSFVELRFLFNVWTSKSFLRYLWHNRNFVVSKFAISMSTWKTLVSVFGHLNTFSYFLLFIQIRVSQKLWYFHKLLPLSPPPPSSSDKCDIWGVNGNNIPDPSCLHALQSSRLHHIDSFEICFTWVNQVLCKKSM